MLTWQNSGPTTQVSTTNVDDGVLAVGMEHHNGVTRGRGRNRRETVEANSAAAESVGDEAPVGVIPDLSDEVGWVIELGGARGLVGALPAGERLAGPRRESLTLAR